MPYRVTVPGWGGGGALASTTPCVLWTSDVQRQIVARCPAGWVGASPPTGNLFITCNQPRPGHTIAVTITAGGPLGLMKFTYTVDNGATQGPITSQMPTGTALAYTYAVPN